MPVVTSGDSSITFSEGKSFRSLAQQKKMWVDFKAEFNESVTSAQIGFSGYTTGDGDLDSLYNPLSLANFAFDFSGRKVFDPAGQFVFSYEPNVPIRLQATINPTGYDYYLNGVGIASNVIKNDFVISDFFVDVTGDSEARLKVKDLIIDGDVKHSFMAEFPALIDYANPDISVEISGKTVRKYSEEAGTFLETSEPYFSAIFDTKTNSVRWPTDLTGAGFQSSSIEDHSSQLSGLLGTGIQYSGILHNNPDLPVGIEKFDILLNSNHGQYTIPTSVAGTANAEGITNYSDASQSASIKKNKITSDSTYENYIDKGTDAVSPPGPSDALSKNSTKAPPDTQTIFLSSEEGYLLDFYLEQVAVGIQESVYTDEIATNEYYLNYRLIPLDPERQLSDPNLDYKFPLKYSFISGDGNEGEFRVLKGVALADSPDKKYTSPIDDAEYELSRGGEYAYVGVIGAGFPITRGNVGDPSYPSEIVFTGAWGATGSGVLGSNFITTNTLTHSMTPVYGDTIAQNVNKDQVSDVIFGTLGKDSTNNSPLIIGSFYDEGRGPAFTGAAVLYNTTGYTKSVYDWALWSGDYLNALRLKSIDGKQEYPKDISTEQPVNEEAAYLDSFTVSHLKNGTELPFRIKNKFYADEERSEIRVVFSGMPTGDNVTVQAKDIDGNIKSINLGKVTPTEDTEAQITEDEYGNKVIELKITGGASQGVSNIRKLQDDLRINTNESLQVSGDGKEYFDTYSNYYNKNLIGQTVPWDPKDIDPDGYVRFSGIII